MAGEESQANAAQASARGGGAAAAGLAAGWSLVKTPEGRDEITRRSRGLDQRQRMVLLLVDGRRTIAQIRNVASQVGASDSCLDDLLDMGLVALPSAPQASAVAAPPTLVLVPPPVSEPVADAAPAPRTASSWPTATALRPTIVQEEFAPSAVPRSAPSFVVTLQESLPPTIPAEPDRESESPHHLTSELFDEFVRANAQAHQDEGPTTTSASLRSGRIDSMMSTLFPLLESAFGALGRTAVVQETQDAGLEEARRILVREVRAKAPVTGALTLVKLRRAMTREELLALFDEVGSHISIPMRRLSTQQTLLHVRSLLDRQM